MRPTRTATPAPRRSLSQRATIRPRVALARGSKAGTRVVLALLGAVLVACSSSSSEAGRGTVSGSVSDGDGPSVSAELVHAPDYGFDLANLQVTVDASHRVVEVGGYVTLLPGKNLAHDYAVLSCNGLESSSRAELEVGLGRLTFRPLTTPIVPGAELDLLGELLTNPPCRAIVLRRREGDEEAYAMLRLGFRSPM